MRMTGRSAMARPGPEGNFAAIRRVVSKQMVVLLHALSILLARCHCITWGSLAAEPDPPCRWSGLLFKNIQNCPASNMTGQVMQAVLTVPHALDLKHNPFSPNRKRRNSREDDWQDGGWRVSRGSYSSARAASPETHELLTPIYASLDDDGNKCALFRSNRQWNSMTRRC